MGTKLPLGKEREVSFSSSPVIGRIKGLYMFFHVGPGTKESSSIFKTDPTVTLIWASDEYRNISGKKWLLLEFCQVLNSVNLT